MENNIFLTQEEEIQRTIKELTEIKYQVKELLSALNRIEKRLQVIVPVKKNVKKTQNANEQICNEKQLAERYENLVSKYKSNSFGVLAELQMAKKDELVLLAKYSGCSVSRQSKPKLIDLIVGRLKESWSLREGI